MIPPLINIAIAILIFIVLVWLLRSVRIWTLRRLEKIAALPERFPRIAGDLRPQLIQAAQTVVRMITTVAMLFVGYLWLVYLLEQFPYSAAWGNQLGNFLIGLFLDFGRGALGAIPGLIAVAIVILIARWCVRVVNVIFKEMDRGKLSLPGLERETARTTQTLLIFAVWLFALVVAYPFIPGSDTEAFKGLSVLVGLMITLGSTGLINQVISGLFVIYSRSLRTGDYVRVGDIEGQVMNVGFLATKLKTPRQEESPCRTRSSLEPQQRTTVGWQEMMGWSSPCR
jgi:small-conductance mechanosensitive channel